MLISVIVVTLMAVQQIYSYSQQPAYLALRKDWKQHVWPKVTKSIVLILLFVVRIKQTKWYNLLISEFRRHRLNGAKEKKKS